MRVSKQVCVRFFLMGCLLCIFTNIIAQKDSAVVERKDTTVTKTPKKRNNIFKSALGSITRSMPDSLKQAQILNTKSDEAYLPYEGKIIRHITIKTFGFEKSFTDTSRGIKYFGTRLLNSLHHNSEHWVIRDNLFIHEGNKLNPQLVADNERYLRSLNFIRDARILVNYLPGELDSVDVVVITKDLFSITGALNDLNNTKFKGRIADVNFLGMGQRVQFDFLASKDRTPGFAYQLLYQKYNIANTFINGTIAFTTLGNNLNNTRDNVHGFIIQLDRPLYSQYAQFAGSLLYSRNQTFNDYKQPDSVFYKYDNNVIDGWVGYNFSAKKVLADNSMRDRKFVSLRYFRNMFPLVPAQIGDTFNSRFNNRTGILSQFTFFKQDFYKTNYIYGFGTTEDVPYGYNVSFVTGWVKQLTLSRPYFGIDANQYVVSPRGDFAQYFFRTGGYWRSKRIEDASILIGTSVFSRLYLVKQVKLRQYFRLSFTRLFNTVADEQLKINNPFGLRYFRSDTALGNSRLSLHSETFLFLKYKLLGFQFAPFAYLDASILKQKNESIGKSKLYSGLGGGVRTRNENLVFNTIEFRAIYFPRSLGGNSFKFTIISDINFRYNTNYVRAPEVVQVNADYSNSLY